MAVALEPHVAHLRRSERAHGRAGARPTSCARRGSSMPWATRATPRTSARRSRRSRGRLAPALPRFEPRHRPCARFAPRCTIGVRARRGRHEPAARSAQADHVALHLHRRRAADPARPVRRVPRAGGPAPMPLTTAEETVPWGESIRLELIAGHMPPWSAMSDGAPPASRRGADGARAERAAHVGDAAARRRATPSRRTRDASALEWPLGPPDATLALPEVTRRGGSGRGDAASSCCRSTRQPGARCARWTCGRAHDRSCAARASRCGPPRRAAATSNGCSALWVPGDQPVALPAGAAFAVPADAELVVTRPLQEDVGARARGDERPQHAGAVLRGRGRRARGGATGRHGSRAAVTTG